MLKTLIVLFILFIGVIYIISPIDLFPELLFGPFGYIDDAFVGLAMFVLFFKGIL